MANPYMGRDDYCFWSRAMTTPHPGQIDPVTKTLSLSKSDKIVTMGSCFAQHLSKHIQRQAFNYFVTESAPDGISSVEAQRYNYGVFSARYGNIYTVRQAVQLVQRAFDGFVPAESIWNHGSRFVDAFRPRIEPDGYSSREALETSRAAHLDAVRRAITECDWLVFTLGLTEAWRSKIDGAIFPLAPGVNGGSFDLSAHEFVNFSASEVSRDLFSFIEGVTRLNSKIKIMLTVSPVPLIATYEPRHVLVSTTYSKSALRVAADEAERRFANVIYFPAYEIITSPAAAGQYYCDDLREVTEVGVRHVMRMFSKHFLKMAYGATDAPIDLNSAQGESEIVCDEEAIDRALQISGFRA